MVRKTAKSTLCLVMIFYFVFLTLFGLGDYLYPDHISVYSGEEPEDVFCFSLSREESDENRQEAKVMAFGFLPVKSVRVNSFPRSSVIPGGELIGIRMNTDGLLVASFGAVQTAAGTVSPGEAAGLRKGDTLTHCDGVKLKSAADFVKLIVKSGGKEVSLQYVRDGKVGKTGLTPVLAADGGGWKAGLWVRDGAAGIGTVTFTDPVSGKFSGLGHAVCDSESRTPFPMESGSVCHARVDGILKGEGGKAGEIRGHLETEVIGTLSGNTAQGVYGSFSEKGNENRAVPIGLKSETTTGKATLFCTLDDSGKKPYEIEIEEIIDKDRDSKNFILHITDPALIEKTGGIVQGMSGSPILQNGKLIGAVTHVLVDDPTRGYGIFIENMLSGMPE